MINKNDQYHVYEIAKMELIMGNNKAKPLISEDVISFSIDKRFDTHTLPVFRLTMMMYVSDYANIIKEKEKSKLRININTYIRDVNVSKPFKRKYIDGIFIIVSEDNTPLLNNLISNTKDYKNSPITRFIPQEKIRVDLFLFKEEDLVKIQKFSDSVLTSGTMTDAVCYSLSNAGITSNILMNKIENTATFKEIVIPPSNVVNAIRYLNHVYGFYKGGYIFFLDHNIRYFINKSSKCTAYAKGEVKDVYLRVGKSGDLTLNRPSVLDKKSNTVTVYVRRQDLDMMDMSIHSDKVVGDTMFLVDSHTSAYYINKTDNKNVGSGTKFTEFIGNQYTIWEDRLRHEELSNVVKISFSNIDVDLLSPNKRFILSFEDTKTQKSNGGDYRLASVMIQFSVMDRLFYPVLVATFYKAK